MNCVIVVFYMPDCPACHEYLPRFKKVAEKYPDVQTYVLDSTKHEKEADKYNITGVPETLVLRKPEGAIRAAGALPNDQIDWMFETARKYK